MSEPGLGVMGTAQAGGPDRASKAADAAAACPLLEGIDLSGAKAALVLMAAKRNTWRSARTQAAAKVEALSSNGMDEIEIPAFLRKQAD